MPHRPVWQLCARRQSVFDTVIDPAQIAEVALGYQA